MNRRRAVIWGASGGIGRALVDELETSGDFAAIYAGSRVPMASSESIRPFAFDLLDEASIVTATATIEAEGPIDLAIIATGMLHDGRHYPEKSFAAISAEAMITLYRVNTVGPTLIAKNMVKLLPKDRRSVLAALSARVGSIGDNRLGGWHSYRASKAALNMIIANLAIELGRTRPFAVAVGLHPGTVDTRLSMPFQRRVAEGGLFAPETSARHLLSVIGTLEKAASGRVLAWDGVQLPC